MSDRFDEFQKKYPKLFKEYPRSGFDARPGWDTLIHVLCATLERAIERLPEEIREGVQCAQVKEKFGGLRFYMTNETPYMSGAISVAEGMSYHICEACGLPGKVRSGGWILTLCDKHHEEQEAHKKAEFKEFKQRAKKAKEKK
jgi:hypothetical protein